LRGGGKKKKSLTALQRGKKGGGGGGGRPPCSFFLSRKKKKSREKGGSVFLLSYTLLVGGEKSGGKKGLVFFFLFCWKEGGRSIFRSSLDRGKKGGRNQLLQDFPFREEKRGGCVPPSPVPEEGVRGKTARAFPPWSKGKKKETSCNLLSCGGGEKPPHRPRSGDEEGKKKNPFFFCAKCPIKKKRGPERGKFLLFRTTVTVGGEKGEKIWSPNQTRRGEGRGVESPSLPPPPRKGKERPGL